MVVTVCFSFMSQESWTSHLCVPSLLQLHGTEEKSDRRRLAREDKEIDRWKEIFFKRKAKQSSRSCSEQLSMATEICGIYSSSRGRWSREIQNSWSLQEDICILVPQVVWVLNKKRCKPDSPAFGRQSHKNVVTYPKHACCF